MHVLTDIPFHVDRNELFERLHLGEDSDFLQELHSLADQADAVGKPKLIYDEVLIDNVDQDGIRVGGIRFASRVMAKNLEKTDRIFPYVCTCGVELDSLSVPSTDDFGRFGLELIKEMALRQATIALAERIRVEVSLEKTSTMNPGSGDRSLWPIEEQRPLFKLLGSIETAIGVHLTDSFLMLPNKSVSGFYYKTDKESHNCQLCKREHCPNRQKTFDSELWRERAMGYAAETT